MGIRIKSDGTVTGTRLYDDNGNDITAQLRVRKLTIEHEVGGAPVAKLECFPDEIDIACQGQSLTDITCLADRSLMYTSGRPSEAALKSH